MFGEGLDVPQIECVILARPTKSRLLFAQFIGRGIAPAPGKSELLVIDFEWLTKQHQLVLNPTTLLLADELPGVQSAATEVTGDPVADVNRARAAFLHTAALRAYTREEVYLLMPPADVLGRTDRPPASATYVQADSSVIIIPCRRLGQDDPQRGECCHRDARCIAGGAVWPTTLRYAKL